MDQLPLPAVPVFKIPAPPEKRKHACDIASNSLPVPIIKQEPVEDAKIPVEELLIPASCIKLEPIQVPITKQEPVEDVKIPVEELLIPASCIKLEPVDYEESEEVIPDEFVTADILGVENKIKKRLDKERRRVEKKKSQGKTQRAAAEEEVRTARYNRLMHLFEASTFYSTFMKEKLNDVNINKTKRAYKKSKRAADAESLGEVNPSTSKPKKVKHSDAYNVAEVVHELKMHDGSKQIDKDNLAEDADTYVNSLGLTVPRMQPRLFEGGVMRDYQVDGLQWLRILDASSVSGILADEMGLGKTIQVIALICHLIGEGIVGPFVIIAPLSTIPNWMAEFKRFAPQVPTLLLHGTEPSRRNLIREFGRLRSVAGFRMHPVVVTSFQIPLVEKTFFRANAWRYLVVDEGHRIKNHQTQLAVELKRLNAVTRLIMTGTPLQNNLAELWSLLNFLLPEIFTDLSSFESWFDCKELLTVAGEDKILAQEQEQKILGTMHQILSPFLLRRLKSDVELYLPPKRERLVFCPMSPTQKLLYGAVLDRSIDLMASKLRQPEPVETNGRPKRRCVSRRSGKSYADAIVINSDDDDDDYGFATEQRDDPNQLTVSDLKNPTHKWHVAMQRPLMALRHVVNHPYLVQMPVEPDGRSGRVRVRVDEDLVRQSGKMLVLDALLARLKLRGHKVLIFSSFTMMLDLLADFMELRDYDYCQLDGRIPLAKRQEQIRRFNTEPETFVFLISTRAGGLGINLTAADTVITYDSDWNPQADIQAQDRCHRIGQTKPVLVFRLSTEGTVDQMIIERAAAKRKLEKMIIQKGGYDVDTKLTKMESIDLIALRTLLRSDDFESVVHSNGYVFDNNELEALLDRSFMTKKKNKTKPKTEAEE